jgi:hypothetical protein
MPPLDPVSQIFENQFINAWELFEAHQFDKVSTSSTTTIHNPTNISPRPTA